MYKFTPNSIFYSTDNELYSGTVADFSGSDPIIYREPLQTEQYDSLSLNGKLMHQPPEFRSSFIQQFIHFVISPFVRKLK